MAADSKTEKATPKKRRDERKEGNIFQSTDIVNVVLVFVSFYGLKLIFPMLYETAGMFMKRFLGLAGTVEDLPGQSAGMYGMEFVWACVKTVLPLALVLMTVGIIMHGIQTKFLFTAKNFYPKFNRISPLQGIKKLFSLKNVIEPLKNMLKIIILLVVVYTMLKDDSVKVVRTMDMSIEDSAAYIFDMIMSIILRVTLVFSVIAFFDYLFQRWDYERKIKMSKQEVKEEYKQTEGNPEIKGKIRELQKQRAMSRMMQAVPDADVIIRNPTHFAVALSYDEEKNGAPVVVAKGQDELALRIVKVGEENHVAVIEDKPLARGLYAKTDLNQEIPSEYYGAVAEVLVYVYKLNKKMR